MSDKDPQDCASCGMFNAEEESCYCERCGFNLCNDNVCLYAHLRDHHDVDFLKPGFWEEKE